MEVSMIFRIFNKNKSIKRNDLSNIRKVNLCCGTQKIPEYIGLDLHPDANIKIDLSKENIPFNDNSIEELVCISAINYFQYKRAAEIIKEVYRVLIPGGITRFGVQDLELITKRYVEKDYDFFFQKLPDGRDRFEGTTLGDKYVAWFYGYNASGYNCQYFYDFVSLENLFKIAGFSLIERRNYMSSRLKNIELIDNRPEQMFYLEAIK
jgi:hypothetical protein